MAKLDIKILNSVNGIPFFTSKEQTRKAFGSEYVNTLENKANQNEVNEALSIIEEKIKEVYEEMGKDSKLFEWPDLSQYESDIDRYSYFDLEYDKQGRFVSVTLDAEKTKSLFINDKDCSSFEIKELLKIANDFVWDSINTAYTSSSKQISIWCPEGKNKVESILFGCPGYYD